MFFFHMPRSSIQPMPNSRDATSQAWPKSCEISSLITETRKGELLSGGVKREAGENPEAAFAAVRATIPARNSRRANCMGMTCSWTCVGHGNERRKQIYTIESMNG